MTVSVVKSSLKTLPPKPPAHDDQRHSFLSRKSIPTLKTLQHILDDGCSRILLGKYIWIHPHIGNIVSETRPHQQGSRIVSSSREYTATVSEKSSISVKEATKDGHGLTVRRGDTRNEDSTARDPGSIQLRRYEPYEYAHSASSRKRKRHKHMTPTQSVSR